MAKSKGKTAGKSGKAKASPHYCSLRTLPRRQLAPNVGGDRARLILVNENKWVNGTTLRYFFFKSPAKWVGAKAEQDVVRKAFKMWKDLGLGLEFKEVDSAAEAEIRIGFLQNDGSWSYMGRDVLHFGSGQRTMNFGWKLAGSQEGLDTALHEIGHTLGFPHEHQNPNAGIVWDEEAVYESLAAPPNEWSRAETFSNIIEKIAPDTIQGSNWDPDSIMHYPFEAGLILKPAQYKAGLEPAGNLSSRDKTWVQTFYPPQNKKAPSVLKALESRALSLAPGQQVDFTVQPTATRNYEFRTFGASDTIMVLFENVGGEERFKKGDDDSGEDRNAYFKLRLYKGRKYVLRIRLYYAEEQGETAVMMW